MSKLWVNLFMLNAKAIVNAYTWTTLPFYTIAQRPWHRLKLSRSLGVKIEQDRHGRTVYSRPCPIEINHPLMGIFSVNEVVPKLDLNRRAVGVRETLSEQLQLDENGEPIKIDGKVLKKVTLAKDYKWYSVGEVLKIIDSIARGLEQLGVRKNEKVLIYADNSFEWFCCGMSMGRLNGITVTLLSILNNDGVVYGANQSEAKYMITSEDLLPRIAQIDHKFENLNTIVYFRDKLRLNNPTTEAAIKTITSKGNIHVTTLDEVQRVGDSLPPKHYSAPNVDDVALIMYTSGTTGNPKGVMLTHRQLGESLNNMLRMTEEMKIPLEGTSYAAYLPMAHLYGYLFNMACFFSDCSLALCSSMTMLDSSPAHVRGQPGDFHLLKPQFLSTVPLVLDRILKEVYRKLEARTPISAPIFTYLMDYKIRWRSRGYDTPITNALVCKKINKEFGGNLQIMMVGSAPLNARTQALVQSALNVFLLQGYGATETAVACTAMMKQDLTYGECGVPLHCAKYYLKDWAEGGYSTQDKPNPRGEIVVGGAIIANGYYKMPEETAEAFSVDEEGTRWFETGDIGEVLPNGTLKIIDRKKDLTKLANGEFISLGKIEAGLRSCQLVENICICTNPYSNYITAIVSPNRKSMAELAVQLSKQHLSFTQLCDDANVQQYVLQQIKDHCSKMGLAKKEIPERITLVKEEWTQDNNLLTAAFKLKRREVNEYYRDQIKQMFAEDNEGPLSRSI